MDALQKELELKLQVLISMFKEKWNIADSQYAHIVGNGTDDSNRSNMHLVDWNGNVWYAGGLYLGDLDFQALNNVENALGNNKLVINGDINVTGENQSWRNYSSNG